MSIKKWFGQRSKSDARESLTVDDLMVLERWDEAEQELTRRLRSNSKDLHSADRLAEVYRKTGRNEKALDQYLYVIDRWSSDGFYDKAIAVLAKATKLAPADTKLRQKMKVLERMRSLDRRLTSVMRTLSQGEGKTGQAATASYLELRRVWTELASSDLMDRLDDQQLGRLLQSVKLERLAAEKEIITIGQKLEELFMLTEGSVEIVVELPNGETTALRSLEPGDLVGERALLERRPWPATYRTVEACVVLKLDRGGLEKVLHGNPDPRSLLDALREKRLDSEVESAVQRTLRA